MRDAMRLKNNSFRSRCLICCMTAAILAWLHGCASTSANTRSPSSVGFDRHQPVVPTKELVHHQQPFEGRLPLGIGARFDFLIADTASGMADFYASYIQPLRKGKLFNRQPYQLDYSILPKSGDAFTAKKSSLLNTLAIKSDYKLQIGVSRHFHSLTDFFNPNFWLATGKYSTSVPTNASRSTFDELSMRQNSEDDWSVDLNQPANFDLETLLDDRWGLSSSADQ